MTTPFAEAERIAAAIGPLRIARARARAAAHAGSHPRRSAGAGHEFWQYRPLAPGEPADRIDWRRSARSDDLFVREREREDPVRLWLWVDGSASMDYASAATPTKADAALSITGAIAIAAHEAGETCCVPPEPRALNPDRLLPALTAAAPPPNLPPLGPTDVVVAAGDFLDADALDWVATAAAAGASGVIVAVADRAEIDFPFSGRVCFDAIEAGDVPRDVARAEALADRYAAAWAAHRARLAAAAARPGWRLVEALTDEPPGGHAAAIAAWLGSGS